jgi:hypothetical protein
MSVRTIMPMPAPPMSFELLALHEEFTPEVFPRDLAGWMSPAQIHTLALRLAQRSSNDVAPVFSFNARRIMNPWRVLALWLYCAARGACTPLAAHAFVLRDEQARQLCAATPTLEVLVRFRAQNLRVAARRLEELLATSVLHAGIDHPFARCLQTYLSGEAHAEAERRLSLDDSGGQRARLL